MVEIVLVSMMRVNEKVGSFLLAIIYLSIYPETALSGDASSNENAEAPLSYYQKAIQADEQNQCIEAGNYYDLAAQADSGNCSMQRMRIFSAYQCNASEKAIRVLESLKSVCLDPELEYLMYILLLETGKEGKALNVLDAMRRLFPDAAVTHLVLSDNFRRNKNYVEAEREVGVAELNEPKNTNVYLQKGILLSEMGKYSEALDAYKISSRLDPHLRYAHHLAAQLCQKVGDKECEVEQWESILLIDLQDVEALNSLAEIYYKDDKENKALKYLDAIWNMSKWADGACLRGIILSSVEEATKAIESLKVCKDKGRRQIYYEDGIALLKDLENRKFVKEQLIKPLDHDMEIHTHIVDRKRPSNCKPMETNCQ